MNEKNLDIEVNQFYNFYSFPFLQKNDKGFIVDKATQIIYEIKVQSVIYKERHTFLSVMIKQNNTIILEEIDIFDTNVFSSVNDVLQDSPFTGNFTRSRMFNREIISNTNGEISVSNMNVLSIKAYYYKFNCLRFLEDTIIFVKITNNLDGKKWNVTDISFKKYYETTLFNKNIFFNKKDALKNKPKEIQVVYLD